LRDEKMKKLMFAIMFVMLLATVAAEIDTTDIMLGGSSQQRGVEVHKEVIVSDVGPEDVTILGFKTYIYSDYDDIEIQSEYTSGTISAGDEFRYAYTATIPLDLDAVDEKGRELVHKIGYFELTYNVSGTEYTEISDIYMQAENLVEFGKLKIIVEGDSSTLRDGKEYDVVRDDNLEVSVEVENKFSSKGDCNDPDDYGDCTVDVDLELESDDSDMDIDESESFDVDSDDQVTETFTFSIPDDIDEDDYNVELRMVAEDENGALHGEFLEFSLKVDVPKDNIEIKDLEVMPEYLSCERRSFTLDVTLKNTGSRDQDEVSIFVESSELDIAEEIFDMSVDEGDTETKSFGLMISKDATPGVYYLKVIANVDNDEETDRDAIRVTVEDCPDEDDYVPPVIDDDDDDVIVPPTGNVIYGEPKEDSFFDSKEYVMILGAIFVLALIMLFVLIVVLVKG